MISEARDRIERLKRDLEHARRSYSQAHRAMRESKRQVKAAKEALEITEEVSRQIQERIHFKLASVVSKCLQVFDDPYEFKILFERKRNQTEARLVFDRDGLEIDPLGGAGGGVVDVAAFALRLAALSASRPTRRKVVFMDESFKFVSKEYRPAIRELIETLAEDLGIQIILITHIPELVTGKVVEI